MPFKKYSERSLNSEQPAQDQAVQEKHYLLCILHSVLRMTGTRSHLSTQNTEELSFTQIVLTSVQENFSMMN